jgi:proteasomal ATPase-associated factor 1
METRTFAHLDIQHDWSTACREGDRKIWASLRRIGRESIHGHLYLRPNEGIVREESQFEIVWKSENMIKVAHKSTGTNGVFVSPSKSFRLHNKTLTDLDISPSGGLGVVASVDGQAWVWDTENGQIRRTLEGHYGDVNTCRFFPSGVVVLTGGADFRLKIWSAQDGSCPRTFVGHTRGINDTTMIDKGRNFVSVSSDGSARLWECGSGRCLRTLLEGDSPITSCCCMQSSMASSVGGDQGDEFGVAGKVLAVTSDKGTLSVVDMRDGSEVFLKQFTNGLTTSVFTGETGVIVGTDKGEVVDVDLRNTRQPIRTLITSSEVTSLQMAESRKCIMATGDIIHAYIM